MEQSLTHHGVLGMRWGIRKDRRSSGESRSTRKLKRKLKSSKNAEDRKKLKRALKQSMRKDLNRIERIKARALQSPTKLYKYRHLFTEAEIEKAMKRMRQERDLRQLSNDEILSGAKKADALLKYVNTGTAIYNLGNAVSKKIKRG